MVKEFDSTSASKNTPYEPVTIDHSLVHYNMNHQNRGLAIIFNHEFFEAKLIDRRYGTVVDCKTLIETFEYLDFDVRCYNDSTYSEITKKLEDVASMDHSKNDCLVVIVLSHGNSGKLLARDCEYDFNIIWHHFTEDKSPTLAGKPKLFIIQACRGKEYDNGVLLEDRTMCDSAVDDEIRCVADCLIAYSTLPGFFSWRNEVTGSWFLQALCKELRDNGRTDHLMILLTSAFRSIAINYESNTPNDETTRGKKQIPQFASMLRRLVTFPPKANVISSS